MRPKPYYLLANCAQAGRFSPDGIPRAQLSRLQNIARQCCIYNHPIYYLETFVDTEKFLGTCYRACGWIYLGETTGRGGNDRTNKVNRSIKAVWGYPLIDEFRQRMCGAVR